MKKKIFALILTLFLSNNTVKSTEAMEDDLTCNESFEDVEKEIQKKISDQDLKSWFNAAEKGYLNVIYKLYQKYGYEIINVKNLNKLTALALACTNNNERIANFLLIYGADTDILVDPKEPITLLEYFVVSLNLEFIKRLLFFNRDIIKSADSNALLFALLEASKKNECLVDDPDKKAQEQKVQDLLNLVKSERGSQIKTPSAW